MSRSASQQYILLARTITFILLVQCHGIAQSRHSIAHSPSTAPENAELKSRLIPISTEHGGGYVIDTSGASRFTKEEMEQVVKIPGIRAIYDGDEFPGWEMHYSEVKTFEQIYFQRSVMSDAQLEFINKSPCLESLIIDGSYAFGSNNPEKTLTFSAAALVQLRQLKQLRQLMLKSDKLTDDALAEIGEIPGLVSLQLTGHFTSKGLNHLRNLTSLRRLSLRGHFDDDGLACLAGMSQLESLILQSDRMNGRGLAYLCRLPRLKLLKLQGLGSESTLDGLQGCPELDVLNLSDGELNDAVLSTLKADKIRSLSLRGSQITDQGIKSLQRFKNLQELDLLRTSITDDSMQDIASCRSLRKLLLGKGGGTGKCLITEVGLSKLSQLPFLEELDLRYVDTTTVDLQVLAFPSLKKLNFDYPYAHVRAQIDKLRQRNPGLDAVTTKRISIRADLLDDENRLLFYNIYTDRLDVEI